MPSIVYAFVHLALARIERPPHPLLTPLFQVRRLLLATAVPLLAVALVRGAWMDAALFAASTLTFMDRYRGRCRPRAAPAGEHRATAARKTPEGFRVCTLNAGAHRSDPARIAAYLADSGADVVALQEIGPQHVSVLRETLKDEYPHQVLFGRGVSGIGLLSKHPLLEDELIELEGPHPYLAVTADVHGSPVRFLAVHPMVTIAMFGEVSGSGRDCHELARLAARGGPCVVLGDFNTTDETGPYDAFPSAGLIDAFRAADGGWGPTFPVPLRYLGLPLPPLVRIDFVFHSPELVASSAHVGADAGSDHLPVFADLEWVETPARTEPELETESETGQRDLIPRAA